MGIISNIKGSWSKVSKFREIIKQNGGFRNSLWRLYLWDDIKDGVQIGEDKYGNKYYENNRYFFGRNRWVLYGEYHRLEYDGSMVPAEWYGWLHYKTDLTPCEDEHKKRYFWTADHTANMSGTSMQYMPYSTTRQKIQVWDPNCKCE